MPLNARHWKLAAAAALLTLLLFQSAGWSLTWQIMHWEAKSAAQITLNRRETPLQTLKIVRNRLPALRVDKNEIRFEGRLYDIKNQKIEGDSVTLTLYHDRHEEAVLNALTGLIAPGGNAESLPLQRWLAQWLGMAFILPATSLLPASDWMEQALAILCPTLAAQSAPGCFSPPPEQKSFHDIRK